MAELAIGKTEQELIWKVHKEKKNVTECLIIYIIVLQKARCTILSKS